MEVGLIRIVRWFVAALCLAVMANGPAIAQDQPITPGCIANAPADETAAALLQRSVDWHCADEAIDLLAQDVDLEGDRVLVRFMPDPAADAPRYFITRLGGFDGLTLAARAPDGKWFANRFTTDEVRSQPTRPAILVPLPETFAQAVEIVAIIDRPSHAPMALNAELHSFDPAATKESQRGLVILAVLLGMVLLPIIFDLTFFRVLRQSFLPWHMAMSASFGLLLSVRSGLINVVFPVSIETWRVLLIMGLTAAIVSALMFMRAFIEPGKLSPWIMKCIPWVAVFSCVLTGLHALAIPALRPVSTTLHMIGVIVPYLLLSLVILQSVWRRSRAGLFVFVGWIPILVSSWGSMISHITPFALPSDALLPFYVGMLTEMIATALGVGDRFMSIKQERDVARAKAVELDTLSNSDPLTGMANRRTVEPQFQRLRREGFHTLALIDLDRFKSINDDYGHAVGDHVLKATARALRADKDTLAVRLGGEEFLLMLRGKHANERAERMRQAIPVLVSREVAALDRMVTASMGMIQIQRDSRFEITFEEIYTKADRLLYEAKELGRNRTVQERLTTFASHHRTKPSAAA
ncbi:GGDEF domain-containing protein [Altererythrobacter sp.]|nr:GGDEF domain-containing protein [Altererythrobacter sp.]